MTAAVRVARMRWWSAVAAWALWMLTMLGLAAVLWMDRLLRQAGRIDVLLSARRVGPTGKAYGLDMTEEMLALARRNATEAGAGNVEFLMGHIEAIPLPAATVDVVISSVINLSVDKPAVFAETFRVLKPGGRLGVSDIVAEDHLTAAERGRARRLRGLHRRRPVQGRVPGWADGGELHRGVGHLHPQVADGLHSAIIRAVRPVGATAAPHGGA